MIAETGTDMGRFPTPGHLAAGAGLAPASHESAAGLVPQAPDTARPGAEGPSSRVLMLRRAPRPATSRRSAPAPPDAVEPTRRPWPSRTRCSSRLASPPERSALHRPRARPVQPPPRSRCRGKRLQRRIEALGSSVNISRSAASTSRSTALRCSRRDGGLVARVQVPLRRGAFPPSPGGAAARRRSR